MAAPSKAGRNDGKMKPPDWLAARVTFSERATSMRCEADSLVQTISAPASWQIRSARAAGRHRQGDPGPGDRLGHQGHQDEERLVVAEHVAGVVDDVDELAPRVEHGTEVGARRPHQLGHPGGRRWPGRRPARRPCWRRG